MVELFYVGMMLCVLAIMCYVWVHSSPLVDDGED